MTVADIITVIIAGAGLISALSLIYAKFITPIKKVVGSNEKLIKIIPLLAVTLGTMLGIVAFYAVNSLIPADNIFTAILIGSSSGLAATGTNQIFKQLIKKDELKEDVADGGTRKED